MADLAADELRKLILGMRAAYARGENVMEYARSKLEQEVNLEIATLIAYDLQAGSYVRITEKDSSANAVWCSQLAELLQPFMLEGSSILEVGCGEATTLAGVLQRFGGHGDALGLDISWSRCSHGLTWLKRNRVQASLFVANLFNIPLADSSVDVVYTSHSLEPNGGREREAIKELLRVARRAVILVEPIYELASMAAQQRMKAHGYVKNLKAIAESLGVKVLDCRLLNYYTNELNPSGTIVIEKSQQRPQNNTPIQWRCPLTFSPLMPARSGLFSPTTGVFYPKLSGVPLLRSEHAVIASAFDINDI